MVNLCYKIVHSLEAESANDLKFCTQVIGPDLHPVKQKSLKNYFRYLHVKKPQWSLFKVTLFKIVFQYTYICHINISIVLSTFF
jgi:hypothetical protein